MVEDQEKVQSGGGGEWCRRSRVKKEGQRVIG